MGSWRRTRQRILTLDQSAGVLPGPDVPEYDVALQRAEKRNAGTDENGYARDDKALHESGPKKSLNGDPAVHVDMSYAAGEKLRDDLDRFPRHPLDHRTGRSAGGGAC